MQSITCILRNHKVYWRMLIIFMSLLFIVYISFYWILIWNVLIHANIDICLPYSNISVVIYFTFIVLFGFVYFQTQLQKQNPKRERKRAADKRKITHHCVVWSLRQWSQWSRFKMRAEDLGSHKLRSWVKEVWGLFGFLKTITHHSSPNFPHSSLITYHSLLIT